MAPVALVLRTEEAGRTAKAAALAVQCVGTDRTQVTMAAERAAAAVEVPLEAGAHTPGWKFEKASIEADMAEAAWPCCTVEAARLILRTTAAATEALG